MGAINSSTSLFKYQKVDMKDLSVQYATVISVNKFHLHLLELHQASNYHRVPNLSRSNRILNNWDQQVSLARWMICFKVLSQVINQVYSHCKGFKPSKTSNNKHSQIMMVEAGLDPWQSHLTMVATTRWQVLMDLCNLSFGSPLIKPTCSSCLSVVWMAFKHLSHLKLSISVQCLEIIRSWNWFDAQWRIEVMKEIHQLLSLWYKTWKSLMSKKIIIARRLTMAVYNTLAARFVLKIWKKKLLSCLVSTHFIWDA